ncbi:MAG: hypothetical protein HY866_03455 [Chloroflexi bacterium]|nr:hypothetical protein [Chloroflexota bacterium]
MRVLIGGVSSSTGRLLAERLLAQPDMDEVIGLDAAACTPPVPGMRFVRAGLCQPEWSSLLARADAALLLIGQRWPLRWGVRGGEMALVEESKCFIRAAVAARVPRLIVVQSAAVYGISPHLSLTPNPSPLHGEGLSSAGVPPLYAVERGAGGEAGPTPNNLRPESPPAGGYRAGAYARARAFVEDYLDTVPENGYNGTLTRLRAAWVCGPHHLALIRHLCGGPVLACGYADRVIQVVHEDDFIAAVTLALRQDCPGVYHVCPDAGLTFQQAASLTGESRDCQPLSWLVLRAWWAWRFRRQPSPPAWVRSLYLSRPMDGARLRAAGWTPRHTSREAMIAAREIFRAGK